MVSKPSRISSLVSARPCDAAGADGLPHQHGVEPAAAALAPGVDAEFLAAAADLLADLVVQLGRERALADPGRVGLADAEHIADRARAHAGAGRRLRRHRVGRGDVGIGAVVDVEQRALRALEQDALALAALDVEQPPHRLGIGQQLAARTRSALSGSRRRRTLRRLRPRRSALWCASRRSILCGSVSRSARSIRRMARRPTLSS